MALTLSELEAARDNLVRARVSGTRQVKIDGREVVYRSDAEMRAALANLDAQIAAMTARPTATTIRFSTSKGL